MATRRAPMPMHFGIMPNPWMVKEGMRAAGLHSNRTPPQRTARPVYPKALTSSVMPIRMHPGMMPNPWMVARGVKAAGRMRAQAAANRKPPGGGGWSIGGKSFGGWNAMKHPRFPKGGPLGGRFMRTLNNGKR